MTTPQVPTLPPSPFTVLFESPAAAAPQGPRTADHASTLHAAFGAYLAAVDAIPSTSWAGAQVNGARPSLDALTKGLVEALRKAVRGQPSLARAAFDVALEAVRPAVERLISIPITRKTLRTVYRMRPGTTHAGYRSKDLFHIPFELGHLVGPQRYSIPGVPMLYLGRSLMACYEEMGSPDPRTLWAAGLRLRRGKELQVLDLAYRSWVIAERAHYAQAGIATSASDTQQLVVDYTLLWPLVLACSFRVLHRGVPFVPEYVLPQLLTSWLAERPTHVGVRYFSSRPTKLLGPRHGSNLALPPWAHADHGHCTYLDDLFEVSRCYSFVDAEASGLLRRTWNHVEDDFQIAASVTNQVTYADSVFGQMQSVIHEFGWR